MAGRLGLARTEFRDVDGVARLVKRSGKTRVAAERAMRAALVERQAPAAEWAVTPATKFVAGLWIADVERAVDAGTPESGHARHQPLDPAATRPAGAR